MQSTNRKPGRNHHFMICVLTRFVQVISIAFLKMIIKKFNSAGCHRIPEDSH